MQNELSGFYNVYKQHGYYERFHRMANFSDMGINGLRKSPLALPDSQKQPGAD